MITVGWYLNGILTPLPGLVCETPLPHCLHHWLRVPVGLAARGSAVVDADHVHVGGGVREERAQLCPARHVAVDAFLRTPHRISARTETCNTNTTNTTSHCRTDGK
jgi:hypothetical protein